MKRRDFIKTAVLGAAAAPFCCENKVAGKTEDFYLQARGSLVTVNGVIAPHQAGHFLPHEHVMSNFGGDPAEPAVYDNNKLLDTVEPYLDTLNSLGGNTLADCTTAYFGRDPGLLKKISAKSGLNIITNTGYYGAADDRYVPEHARSETADELAERWLKEWEFGIGNTRIHPGFIKTGVDSGPLSDVDKKLVTAAARAHKKSGMVIAVHTGDNPVSAFQQLDILENEGVRPTAWIWVHAHNVKDRNALLQAAEKGAWIEFDGLDPDTVELHLNMLRFIVSNGFINQVMVSHDGNSFRYGGRPMRPYHQLYESFIPLMKNTGFGREEIQRIVSDNPRRAFTIQKRLV